MSKAGEERYVFETDWFDIQASLIRKYLFTFFPGDSTIEMVSLNIIIAIIATFSMEIERVAHNIVCLY
jgi:Ca2+-dependent lipid-binding protein